jgi:hypothetical protein
MTCATTHAVGELHPELPGWTEQLAIAMAASGDAHDIRIDRGDRIVVDAEPRERLHVRWAKLLIALAVSLGLGSAALLGAHSFVRSNGAASPPPIQSPGAPAGTSNSSNGYRPVIHPTVVRPADRAAPASVPAAPKSRAPTRIAQAKPPRAVAPPAPPASNYVPPAPRAAPSPAAGAAGPNMEAPLAPVPETKPTTIDGWVLREVVNGTAVLEGPAGIWRVKRGDSVPGVGQIEGIFGWGNRMIVATSRGLISTP